MKRSTIAPHDFASDLESWKSTYRSPRSSHATNGMFIFSSLGICLIFPVKVSKDDFGHDALDPIFVAVRGLENLLCQADAFGPLLPSRRPPKAARSLHLRNGLAGHRLCYERFFASRLR